MKKEDLDNRFTYHAPREGQPEVYQQIREATNALARLMDYRCPDSRELSLAIIHLEDAVMWCNAGIARHSDPDRYLLAHPGGSEYVPEVNNG